LSGTSPAVFLSYASQDTEAASRICEALRAAGIEVWFDRSELRGGDAWDQEIRREIRDCAIFIPVISAHTAARPEGYFRLEWSLAEQRSLMIARNKAFIVPVCLDRTPESGADVPDSFQRVQWTRLAEGMAPAAFAARIAALLSTSRPSAAAASAATETPAIPRRRAGRPARSLRWLAATVVAATVLAVIGWQSWRAHPRADGNEVPAGAPASAAKSIAMLPFADMSEKHDQEYFGDGMAEEILNLLVTIPRLKVIGRTSSFQFKGKADDLRKIGATLGAAYVVEGSVRRSGNHIRVTAQLIDAQDGAHRWSETYDRDVSDVLAVQGEIATGLVRALQLEVTASDHIQRPALRNGEAYDSYLRGLHAWNRFDQAGFEEATVNFRHALDLDSAFALAAEELARTLLMQAIWGFVPPQTGYEQARSAAAAALRLNPKSALAHAVLGSVHTAYDFDWPAAERELKEAMALAPTNPHVLIFAADECLAVGRWNEAVRLMDAASAADPLHAGIYEDSAAAYLRLGRLTEAERAARRVLEITPTYAGGHYNLAVILVTAGRLDAALAEVQKEGMPVGQVGGKALVYQAMHRVRDANAAFARFEADYGNDFPMGVAEMYAIRGQTDEAFKWLDKAYTTKDTNLWLLKGDPLLKNLEEDPRYKALLRKMKLLD
jgi:adenylate cyclase